MDYGNGTCETCGADLIGDGWTETIHCPYAEAEYVEPDADVIYCTPTTWFEDFVNSWSWRLRRWENFRAFIRYRVRNIKNKLKRITKWKR
tara:strand:+ start:137 stop:406 length:270 start_codon:yes stop_codon:yes gene_type:complete